VARSPLRRARGSQRRPRRPALEPAPGGGFSGQLLEWCLLAERQLPKGYTEVRKTDERLAYRVYIGTYTHGKGRGEGIYLFHMDPASGHLEPAGLVRGVANPSYLALAPGGRQLYAVSEVAQTAGQPSGALSALAVDAETGRLTLLNQEATHGAGPCFVSVEATRRLALVANYQSGSVAALPILADGRLGAASVTVQHHGSSVNPRRQAGPHAHSIIPDPTNRFALAADLGLDRILVYRLDAERGTLAPHEPAGWAGRPGAGPRHQAFHPNGRWLYVTNELDSTVVALAWNGEAGTLAAIGTYPLLPAGFVGENTAAHVALAPSGRTLYASNRGHDSIAMLAADAATGALTPIGHVPSGGRTPRHFALDPAGRWLLAANQDSDTVVAFGIDPASGQLAATGQVTRVPTPVCVLIAGPFG